VDDLKAYVDKEIADLTLMDKRDAEELRGRRHVKGYVDGRFNGVEGRFGAVEKRLETVEGRLDTVYSEVSSIKTDIIKMMRELLEKAYGERKS